MHLYQIWILPEKEGIKPNYEQKAIPAEEKQGKLRLVASPSGGNGSNAVKLVPGRRTLHRCVRQIGVSGACACATDATRGSRWRGER